MRPANLRVLETHWPRVVFGSGSRASVPDELDRLGATRVFLVSSPSASAASAALAEALGDRFAARFDDPVVHTPVDVTERALGELAGSGADAILAVGGGAAVGLCKALSVRTGLTQLVLPTTYAGSEVTPVLGETANGIKTTRRDPSIVPSVVVYDAELTLSMPAQLTATSGVNALAHAVEALWAADVTPVVEALAMEAIARLACSLPVAAQAPGNLDARESLLTGAFLAGLCLAQTAMGLHHQLAHALGGSFDLPHASLHALLLPHVMAFNLPAAPQARVRLGRVFDGDPVAGVTALATAGGNPTRLRDLGVPRPGLAAVAERIVAAPYANPRSIDEASVLHLLDGMW